MSLPTVQNATTIKTEALLMRGLVADTGNLDRAENWLRYAINHINKAKDLKLLEITKYLPLPAYINRIGTDDDFEKILNLKIYYGTHYGTIQSVSASTVTLASDEDITEDEAKGKLIFITTSNFAGEGSRIVGYNESTKQVSISPSWKNTPTGTPDYVVLDTEKKILPSPRETVSDIVPIEYPSYYHIYGYQNDIYLDTMVDTAAQYVLEAKYIINLQYLDLDHGMVTNLYNKMTAELVQGVYAYSLKSDNAEIYPAAIAEFIAMIGQHARKDSRERRTRGDSKIRSLGGMPA